MLITWIDKKSVLLHGKNRYKAGDKIPAGILTPARIDALVATKQIKIGEIKPDPTMKKVEIMGVEIEAKVGFQEPEPEPEAVADQVEEEEKPRRGRKSKRDEVEE